MAKSKKDSGGRDWSETLFLPRTDFPMKAGLPEREPELLARWERLGLYERLREDAKGREKYVLHDGPPYANGNIHIGHALNKILKDVIVRAQQMMGKDANYVPGWDCHGLPIEWKVEEGYRAKGKNKDEVPMLEFREECRDFAAHWVDVQREEFKRLGVEGDWAKPYTTMSFDAEATIARELAKFAMNGTLYRGSKPVMWSVVERTALAEAEVEYQEIVSDTVFVKFPVRKTATLDAQGINPLYEGGPAETDYELQRLWEALRDTCVVIWTTTPWTLPGNRAIAFSTGIDYAVYEVTEAPAGNWAAAGDRLLLAEPLAEQIMKAAKVTEFSQILKVGARALQTMVCAHPLERAGYLFDVPLLAAPFVMADTGTGFVHIAPGHGGDDYHLWTTKRMGPVPSTVRPDGYYFEDVPLFGGAAPKRVIDDDGKFGDADDAVIKALIAEDKILARGKLRHDYPHSWRSKAPVIFRNTPQWFIAMDTAILSEQPDAKAPAEMESSRSADDDAAAESDRAIAAYLQAALETSTFGSQAANTVEETPDPNGDTLRARALAAIADTEFVPPQGENRIRGMVETRPDWVVSRQRAWGVPITVFRNVDQSAPGYGQVVPGRDFPGSSELIDRIVTAFAEEGADAWFKPDARDRFLEGLVPDPEDWEKCDDILDVWFDSGSTHAFVLERRDDLTWPASLYLEGSDQHRGWFQSSLLESCGTRGRAPYEAVLTHGFVLHEDGRKMSKSLGNVIAPQDVIKHSGAEILRLWAMNADYAEDIRIGPEILKSNVDSYRKLRNTLRFLLGNLAHFEPALRVEAKDMPELERYVLHRLAELDVVVREGYLAFDFKRVSSALFIFAVNDLSAFYFDIRKDALYCEAYDSRARRACLTVLDEIFSRLTAWLAPMMCFTMEEAWLARSPSDSDSVHLRQFPATPAGWRNEALAEKWRRIRLVRRVVTGAIEIERRDKRIGSSLEAAPEIHVADDDLRAAFEGVDAAEIAITSQATVHAGEGPDEAFRLPDVPGVAVVVRKAGGARCARSWRIVSDVGSDPEFPDLSARDARAVRQFEARKRAA